MNADKLTSDVEAVMKEVIGEDEYDNDKVLSLMNPNPDVASHTKSSSWQLHQICTILICRHSLRYDALGMVAGR